MTARSIALFGLAAVAEIGGAYLMWQAIKEGRGLLFALAGAAALTGYGAVAALQRDGQGTTEEQRWPRRGRLARGVVVQREADGAG